MSETFAKAVATAMEGHSAQSWAAMPQSERAALIYTAMGRIDADSLRGWLMIGADRRAA